MGAYNDVETTTGLVTVAAPAWMVGPVLPLQPGVGVDDRTEDEIKAQMWPLAYEQWLAGGWRSNGRKVSVNTRRAYRRSVEQFQAFIGPRYPMWRVMGSQVIAWQNELRAGGMAETTVNLSLAALSSLYSFVGSKFPFPDPRKGGREMFLVDRNPCDSVNRSRIEAYAGSRATWLAEDEVAALLRSIDQATVVGRRDFALILTIFLTGQRLGAIANMRWGDIRLPAGAGDPILYAWESKQKEGTDELLKPAYEAICNYLQAAGRWPLGKDEYIFVALSNVAERLPNVERCDGSKPLSGSMVNRIVKKWARRAGLDDSLIHTHSLRHSAALFMKRRGVDLIDIQRTLHHSNPSTTMVYLQGMDRERHPLWKSIGEWFSNLRE